MRIAAGMLVLAMSASASVVACRDDRASTTSTTSHVMIPEPSAGDQSNEAIDLALAGAVRRALVADGELGMRAKNVVLVVRDGVVTMHGDVPSAAEHQRVVARVVSVPGVVRIDDRIEVQGANR